MRTELVINGKFLSAPMTGVHRVALELANALSDLTAEGRFAGAEVWLPHDASERSKGLRLRCRTIGPMRGIPWEQLVLPVAARGRILLNLCNIAPVAATNAVTMIHDAQVQISPQSYSAAFGAWYRLTQPLIAKRHRHLLTVSEYSKQQLIKARLGSAERISVVHNGVDHIAAVSVDQQILARLELSRRGFAVGLASTQAHKNIQLLLRAFADPRLAHLKLVLFGACDPRSFEAIGPVSPNVVFSGRVSDGELRALYEHALCIAFPSTTEGFGLPPMEAMHIGCPAIVAPCGALPEVCDSAAIYGRPDCVEDWIQAMLELEQRQDLWTELSRAGVNRASTFTWRRSAEKLLEILGAIGVLAPTTLAVNPLAA